MLSLHRSSRDQITGCWLLPPLPVPPSPCWLLCWGAKDVSFPAPCKEEVTPVTSSSRKGTPGVFLPIQGVGWDVRGMCRAVALQF